jgi:hypothetical protein
MSFIFSIVLINPSLRMYNTLGPFFDISTTRILIVFSNAVNTSVIEILYDCNLLGSMAFQINFKTANLCNTFNT